VMEADADLPEGEGLSALSLLTVSMLCVSFLDMWCVGVGFGVDLRTATKPHDFSRAGLCC